jgi:hypothetical protein
MTQRFTYFDRNGGIIDIVPSKGRPRESITVITAAECKARSEECVDLGTARNISVRRSTILMAMARSWDQLASQRDRYDAILIEEGE